jgi:2',3'-cyclic-nucleotide 2'-phosphodiesterase (5'-nucleotidase family)
MARFARYVERIRDRDQPSVVLHSGDVSIGDPIFSLFLGGPELSLLARIGVDALAVGNHEFDLDPTTLLGTLAGVFGASPPYPLLSCNLDLSQVPGLDAYIDDFRVVPAGALRVGVFGITTPSTNMISMPDPVAVLEDVVPRAALAASTLRSVYGCEIVVMLSHLGLLGDYLVGEYAPGVDVILGGHDHLLFAEPVTLEGPSGPVYLAHAGEYYRYAGRMRMRVDGRGVRVHQYDLVPLDHRHKEDPTVRAQVGMLAAQVEQTFPGMYTQVVTVADRFLDERVLEPLALGFHDTGVGNLYTDALKRRGQTDLAVQPSGQTASPIHPGPVLPVDLFHVNGYGFNAVDGLGFLVETFSIPGAVLWGGIEYGLATLEASDDLLIQVSGNVRYGYDPTEPPLSRLQWITIDGQALDPNALYSVTANQFVRMFVEDLAPGYVFNVQPLGITEFRVLLDHVGMYGLSPQYPAGRILAYEEQP